MAYWYSASVSGIINDLLKNKGLAVFYDNRLSFDQNVERWKTETNMAENELKNIAFQSFSIAFSQKYGNYDYGMDVRDFYPDWREPIYSIQKKLGITTPKNLRISDVGGNCGYELAQIFGDRIKDNDFTVVDIAEDQIMRGRHDFPHMHFRQARMEETGLEENYFNQYFNLRAIQSSGVNQEAAIVESYRILKPGGLAVISVANGYLEVDERGQKKPIRGLFHENRLDQELSKKLALNIQDVMNRTMYQGTGVLDGTTETFIYGIK
jgi:SAM-dependent methyltransferase